MPIWTSAQTDREILKTMFSRFRKARRAVRFLREPSYPFINGLRKSLFRSQTAVHWAIRFSLSIRAQPNRQFWTCGRQTRSDTVSKQGLVLVGVFQTGCPDVG